MQELLYESNEYVSKNPSLHEEDSNWKCSKIFPLLKIIISDIDQEEYPKKVTILDMGGGAGLILKNSSSFLSDFYNFRIRKIAADLTPLALEKQVGNNPDIYKALNEDARNLSLEKKEVDITLLIDVLEHCPSPDKVLQEIARVSKYAILKVPIETSLIDYVSTLLGRKGIRQYMHEQYGHINFYTSQTLLNQISENCGQIMYYNFINLRWEAKERRKIKPSTLDHFSNFLFSISPKLQSYLLGCSIMILVKCR